MKSSQDQFLLREIEMETLFSDKQPLLEVSKGVINLDQRITEENSTIRVNSKQIKSSTFREDEYSYLFNRVNIQDIEPALALARGDNHYFKMLFYTGSLVMFSMVWSCYAIGFLITMPDFQCQ